MNKNFKSLCDKITDKIKEKINEVKKKEAKKTIEIGSDGKPTKKIDKIAEKVAIEVIKNSRYEFNLISEEIGKKEIGKNPKKSLILDPVDGTNNAIKEIPFYSTSIAIIKDEKIKMGYVRDYEREETYFTKKGASYLGNQKINVSKIKNPEDASISLYHDGKKKLKIFSKTFDHIRRMGCISLELCYVASGKLEAFVDLRGAGVMDLAAGSKIIKEAGGDFEALNKVFPSEDVHKTTKALGTNQVLNKKLKRMLE